MFGDKLFESNQEGCLYRYAAAYLDKARGTRTRELARKSRKKVASV